MWSSRRNRMLSSLERHSGLEDEPTYEPEYEPEYDTEYRLENNSSENGPKKKCFLKKYFGCKFLKKSN
tara:strand:- start:6 stop:209 length:204 start_codon:yes stop_codon:yes gene_type:complete